MSSNPNTPAEDPAAFNIGESSTVPMPNPDDIGYKIQNTFGEEAYLDFNALSSSVSEMPVEFPMQAAEEDHFGAYLLNTFDVDDNMDTEMGVSGDNNSKIAELEGRVKRLERLLRNLIKNSTEHFVKLFLSAKGKSTTVLQNRIINSSEAGPSRIINDSETGPVQDDEALSPDKRKWKRGRKRVMPLGPNTERLTTCYKCTTKGCKSQMHTQVDVKYSKRQVLKPFPHNHL